MTGRGNPKGTNRGGGKTRRPNAKRHNVMIDNGVWEYLNRSKQASAEIERLARAEIEQQEAAQ